MDEQFKPISPSEPVQPTTGPTTVSPSPNNQPAPLSGPAPSQPINPLPSQPPAAKSKKNWLRWLAVLVVLAAVGGGTYYALNRVNKPAQPVVQNTKKSVALLRVGVTQPFPSAFYPKSETSVFPAEAMGQIYEGLTKFQNENQVAPNLAASWTNPNTTTWDFKLNPGIKFHDGNDLTAAAVKASIDALQSTDYGAAYGTSIKSVTAKDNLTVEITTKTPDPLLPSELANLWIYDTTGTPNDPGDGTGPYTLKPGTTLNSKTLDLVAVSDYHGGTPMTKEVLFKAYEDPTAVTADLKSGQLDMADVASSSAADQVKPYGFTAYVDKNPQVFFLVPNTLKPSSPLSKLAVRKAVYEAIDPLALMKADGRTGTQATQLVPQDIPGYNPDVKPPKSDVAQAKTDLAAAGYPSGFSFALTYFSTHQAFAQELQKELASAGITLKLDAQTDGPTLAQKALGGKTDMFYFAFGSTLIDSSDVIQPLTIDSANYKNTALDKVYAQETTTFDSQARLSLLEQMNKLVMDDVAVIPLFNPDGTFFAVKSNLVLHTDNLSTYSGVDFWKVYSQ